MRGSLLATASAAAFVFLPTAASAQAASQSQDDVDAETETVEEISPAAKAGEGNTIIVTATRREARLQDVPLPPLIIGLVLGPQFELTMRQGLIITDGSFLAFFTNYPVALGIFVVTGALLLFPILFRSRRHRPADPKGS